jgi:hypothetical protein
VGYNLGLQVARCGPPLRHHVTAVGFYLTEGVNGPTCTQLYRSFWHESNKLLYKFTTAELQTCSEHNIAAKQGSLDKLSRIPDDGFNVAID